MTPSTPLVVVTGGNRGIGKEVCRQLVDGGARVVLASRELERGEPAAAEIGAAAAELDVTDAASVDRFTDRARSEWPRIDALVNNAGVALDGFDAEVARRTIDVNVHGARRVTDALLPLMPDGGRVVMVSSGVGSLDHVSQELAARFLDPALTVTALTELVERFVDDVAAGTYRASGWPKSCYSVSKIALNALARIVARDEPRVLVNAVCPGWVRTDMGGRMAPRGVKQGAQGIVWATMLAKDGPTGGFFRDGRAIDW